MKVASRFIVSGRVQGVGFRRFVQKNAEALSLTGWTRNLFDGRVEVYACGTGASLDQLEAILRKGSPFSAVKEVFKLPAQPVIEKVFEVRPDGGITE